MSTPLSLFFCRFRSGREVATVLLSGRPCAGLHGGQATRGQLQSSRDATGAQDILSMPELRMVQFQACRDAIAGCGHDSTAKKGHEMFDFEPVPAKTPVSDLGGTDHRCHEHERSRGHGPVLRVTPVATPGSLFTRL